MINFADNECQRIRDLTKEMSLGIAVESCRKQIQLSTTEADQLYFIDLKADLCIKTNFDSDIYMPPNTILERDYLCIKAINRHGKIVFIQIWDRHRGIHARLLHKMIRFASICLLFSTSLLSYYS